MSHTLSRHPWNPAIFSSGCGSLLDLATREVFEMMLGEQIVHDSESVPPRVTDLTAMVGLAGRMNGILAIRCEAAVACRMAAKMLGLDSLETCEFDDSARDAIGEICNMIAGNFKAKISGLVDGCVLSIPTVVTGGDYQLHSLAHGSRTELAFMFENRPFWVSLELHN